MGNERSDGSRKGRTASVTQRRKPALVGFISRPRYRPHWKAIIRPASDDEYIFRSRNRTPKDSHNYLRRHLKPLAISLGVANLTFQSLRPTFATLMQGKGTPKDAQTQLRHKDVLTTMNVYTQPIPESVKRSVEALDSELLKVLGKFGQASDSPVQ